MISLIEYIDCGGRSPFERWYLRLSNEAAARITVALVRLARGNFSNVKGAGEGVFEYRVNFGPGYRIYFGKDGEQLIILLLGGDKQSQSRDIEVSKNYWQDYKVRKKEN